MSELATVLSSSTVGSEAGSTIERLRAEAEDLALFYCPSTQKVGFVGDSGAGIIPVKLEIIG